jgi:hypothetical protein
MKSKRTGNDDDFRYASLLILVEGRIDMMMILGMLYY